MTILIIGAQNVRRGRSQRAFIDTDRTEESITASNRQNGVVLVFSGAHRMPREFKRIPHSCANRAPVSPSLSLSLYIS